MQVRTIRHTWVADATGAVADIVLEPAEHPLLSGFGFMFYSVTTVPGTPAPSAGYSLALTMDERDMLEGTGAGRSATVPETLSSVIGGLPAPWPCSGALTISIGDNLEADASGTIVLSFIG